MTLNNGKKYTNVIYKITNTHNNKSYIGLTKDFNARMQRHKASKQKLYLYNSMRKYGIDSFTFEIIDSSKNYSDLPKMEMYYIQKYDTFNNGYNNTLGGEGSKILKLDEKKIINEYNMGKSMLSISKKYDASNHTIKNILVKNNIEIRSIKKTDIYYNNENTNKIIDLYINDKNTIKEISNITNIPNIHVSNVLKNNNINVKKNSSKRNKIQLDEKKIVKMYVNDNKSIDFISKALNVSAKPIKRILKENNIHKNNKNIDKYHDVIIQMYEFENKSINAIKKETNFSYEKISRILKENNIKIRTNNKILFNESIVVDEYFNNSKSIRKIAEELNVGRESIRCFINNYKKEHCR